MATHRTAAGESLLGNNCGACAGGCPTPVSGSIATCNNAQCGYVCPGNTCGPTCVPRYADTDGNPADGCESSVTCEVIKGNLPPPGQQCVRTAWLDIPAWVLTSPTIDRTTDLFINEIWNNFSNTPMPILSSTDQITYTDWESGSTAVRSGPNSATLTVNFNTKRGDCTEAPDVHVICTGTTTLGNVP